MDLIIHIFIKKIVCLILNLNADEELIKRKLIITNFWSVLVLYLPIRLFIYIFLFQFCCSLFSFVNKCFLMFLFLNFVSSCCISSITNNFLLFLDDAAYADRYYLFVYMYYILFILYYNIYILLLFLLLLSFFSLKPHRHHPLYSQI